MFAIHLLFLFFTLSLFSHTPAIKLGRLDLCTVNIWRAFLSVSTFSSFAPLIAFLIPFTLKTSNVFHFLFFSLCIFLLFSSYFLFFYSSLLSLLLFLFIVVVPSFHRLQFVCRHLLHFHLLSFQLEVFKLCRIFFPPSECSKFTCDRKSLKVCYREKMSKNLPVKNILFRAKNSSRLPTPTFRLFSLLRCEVVRITCKILQTVFTQKSHLTADSRLLFILIT